MTSTTFDAWDGLFAAPPRHRAVAKAIELINGNVQQRYYGTTPLCPSGPTSFGKAICLNCGPEELTVGDSSWMPHEEAPDVLVHCLTYKGKIIARKRKSGGGDVTQLGIHNGNNYNEIWLNRDVYGEAEQYRVPP